MIELLAAAVAWVAGWLLVRCGIGGCIGAGRAARLLEAALGAGVGFGLTSVLYFLLLLTGVASRVVVLAVELILVAALAALLVRRRRDKETPKPALQPAGQFRWTGLVALVVAVALIVVIPPLIRSFLARPHGDWDAWAIWNLRARFLVDPAHWSNAVSADLVRTHPEYPLLLPAFVARTWTWAGNTSPQAPVIAAAVFFLAALATLAAGVWMLRGPVAALLAVLLLVANPSFLMEPARQYADIPLCFYMLGALALLVLAEASEGASRIRLRLAAGVMASLAAWTKQEGIVFLALVLAVELARFWRGAGPRAAWVEWRWLLAGAGPGLLLVSCFTIFLAPATGPWRGQAVSQMFRKIVTFDRWDQIGGAFLAELVNFGSWLSHPVVLVAILAAGLRFGADPRSKPAVRSGALILGGMLVAYWTMYLVAADDLNWLLGASFGRLLSQLWPATVLLLFLALGRVEDLLPGVTVPGVPAAPAAGEPHRRRKS